MNSLRDIFSRLSDEQFKNVELSQTAAPYQYDYVSDVDKSAGEAYVAKLTNEVDVVCPVMESGWRQSDIQTMIETSDQRLKNSIAANLTSPVIQSVDTSKLTDEQIASNSIPRNLDMSYIQSVQDSIKEVSTEDPIEPPKTE